MMRGFAFVGFLILAHLPAFADYQTGLEAFEAGKYDLAYREWRPLAEKGDPKAQHALGLLFEAGRGVPQDYTLAAQWYQKGAEQHYPPAENNLALLYADGRGLTKDEARALALWQAAADAGSPWAEFNFGYRLFQGLGTKKDEERAVAYWRSAAEAGNGPASYNLGLYYYHRDDDAAAELALKYFLYGANAGLPESQYMMGELYRQGKGVEENLQQAALWYQLAISNGSELGRQRLADLAENAAVRPVPGQLPALAIQVKTPKEEKKPGKPDLANAPLGPGAADSPDLKDGMAVLKRPAQDRYHLWLGEHRNRDEAQAVWLQLSGKYADVLATLYIDIRGYDLGEQGAVFRIFAGNFKQRQDADHLCALLRKQDGDLFCRSTLN
ncbi:MAG TPA: SPOR domain-containing protein [Dongiaceae bacterium]|jgi:hypothetical protein|nr:SPOR domain-containing protein [Dongiaceae bacterium]